MAGRSQDSAGSCARRALRPLLVSRAVTTSPPRLRLLAVLVGAALALVLAGQASAQPAKPIVRVNATTATSINIGGARRGAARDR